MKVTQRMNSKPTRIDVDSGTVGAKSSNDMLLPGLSAYHTRLMSRELLRISQIQL
jgi:hypothetical protein